MPINRRCFLRTIGRGAAAVAAATILNRTGKCASQGTAMTKPNFLFILIDDMGWRDLGCYGSTFYETTNIDRLAEQGMRFTQAYATCPVCSPTRASILTGKYPARLNLTDWIPGHRRPWARLRVPEFNQQLPLDEVTVAEVLKAAGYATACIGKWHLGGSEFYPEKHGFDLNLGGTDKGQPPSYFSPYRIPTLPDGPAGEYLTDRLTDEALAFIEKHKDRPFFLYLSHFTVHTPLQAKKHLIEKYRAKARPDAVQKNPTYAAMIESLDQGIGRIMARLDELRLAESTVVIFTSDNGGLVGPTSNAPLRAGKGTLYEGGIREPLIVRWPGRITPGSTCHAVTTSADFFPTILAMAGAAVPPGLVIDGTSLLPVLTAGAPIGPRSVYWHYPHYHPAGATPGGAIRDGDLKLIEFFEDGHLELYDLAADPGETRDLASAQPQKAQALRQKLAAWRQSVGARMPEPNPDYDPARWDQGPAPARNRGEAAADAAGE